MISRPRATCAAVKCGLKHEPCEGFWEMFLNVIIQCVRELCQTEDNLSKNRKNRADTREPQKLTTKSHTPPLPFKLIGAHPGHSNKNRALERTLTHQRRSIGRPFEAIPC